MSVAEASTLQFIEPLNTLLGNFLSCRAQGGDGDTTIKGKLKAIAGTITKLALKLQSAEEAGLVVLCDKDSKDID